MSMMANGLRHVRRRIGHPDLELQGDLFLCIRVFRLAEAVENHLRAGGGQGLGDAQSDPLVEPVTNDTLPASACRVLISSGLTAMFIARSLLVGSQNFCCALEIACVTRGIRANAYSLRD